MPLAGVALGSNLGDRQSYLNAALERLRLVLRDLRVSRIIETDPVDVVGQQGPFLNAAAVGEFGGTAGELLVVLHDFERLAGRERPHRRAARTLDLDVIFFGDQQVDEPGLVIPHPRFRERRFVLEPLAELVPDWRDPVTGLTVRQLLDRLPPA